MDQPNTQDQMAVEDVPFIESVFYLTDFSIASDKAFIHALAIALFRKAKLTILHVGDKNLSGNEWKKFPAVSEILERWQLLEEGSSRSTVFEKLGVEVQRVELVHDNVTEAALGYLGRNPTDLLVMATEGRKGLPSWIKPSIAEEMSRKTKVKTLFVPPMSPGIVTKEEGNIQLKSILVPIDTKPNPHAAIEYASRAARMMATEHVDIYLLNVNKANAMPQMDLPENSAHTWKTINRQGNVVDEIIKAAKDESANLIIMPTAGHDGILDVLRGSTTEQVLRQAPCPVLSVPSN